MNGFGSNYSGKINQQQGLETVTGSPQQFPDHAAKLVRFKVSSGANDVFIGPASDELFWLLNASAFQDTGWIPANNLNEFWHSTGAGGSTGTVSWWVLNA